MSEYFAVLFVDLVRHSEEWSRLPRDRIVATIAEYRYLAESLADQYGCRYREWAGDGHMFLFENADAAVRFGLKVIEGWQIGNSELPGPHDLPRLPLRLGCHFGECSELGSGEGWIGRGNAVAKRVESEAEPDTLLVTGNVLDLLDLPLYEAKPVGKRSLKGDHLPARDLYRIVAFRQDALESRPQAELTAEDWFLRGVALIGTDREWSDEEADYYRDALRLRPDYAEAHNNLAVVLRARRQETEAARHYREALHARADYPEAHYNYAALLAARGRPTGVAEHLEEALRLRPEYVDAHHAYANLLRARGDLPGAAEHYRETLRLRPDYPESHNNYAILLEEHGDTAAAAEHYREALRLRPGYSEAHYNYALLLEGLGERLAAEEHYRTALLVRADYPEAHNNLAILLHQQGRTEEAEKHYLAALEARPDDPEAHHNYALLLRAKGDEDGAERHSQIARELAPGTPEYEARIER